MGGIGRLETGVKSAFVHNATAFAAHARIVPPLIAVAHGRGIAATCRRYATRYIVANSFGDLDACCR